MGTSVWPRNREARYAVLTAAAVAAILVVCLYPFRFAIRHGDIDAVGVLVRSWATPPVPIDFILNVALYAPFGAFAALSFGRSIGAKFRIGVVTIGGALLSIAIELAQYFDAARFTAASDVYANVLGTLLAATAAVLVFRR
ncbi:MAG: VanZ family protein [Alphaproteobacteria bacterium]